MSIGERLKEERERLGLTLPEFAERAGAKKNTVIDWQKDVSSPPAAKLAALAEIGVDVLYVITGQRAGGASMPPAVPQLNRREAALLDNYRNSPEDAKAALEKTSAAFAQSAPPGRVAGRRKT